MTTRRTPWAAAGILAGVSGLATSYATAMVLTMNDPPVVAAAELAVRLTPGPVIDRAISLLGPADKAVLAVVVLALLLVLFALAGRLARRSWWAAVVVFVALGTVGAVASAVEYGAEVVDLLPSVVGLVTSVVVLSALLDPLVKADRDPELVSRERRVFVMVAGAVALLGGAAALTGRLVGSGRRHVETTRQLLRIDGVTRRQAPPETMLDLPGISPWQTPNDDFYIIHTALATPTIEPVDWSLRIHGMVERELTVSFSQLVSRMLTESWITLSCVSNPVGGDLVGNARWSGVRIKDLLDDVGVDPDADCVLQTSHDGWTCSTPLAALVDGRDAMLAVAMNGQPLPIEHGFPVRAIVPGLYGYVSATKWVVDLEVTRFDRVEAFWTGKGWAEQGPVKITSRVDVPRAGAEVPAGQVSVGGVAWHQHTGIAGVEVSLDGGSWEQAELAGTPSADTWVQWALTLDVEPGDHELRVRATGRDGEVQTSVERDVRPDGATGLHTVEFSAAEPE